MSGPQQRSAALSTLEALADLPSLSADGLQAAVLATQALAPVDGATLSVLNADADIVGCIGDQMFNPSAYHRFYEGYYDTPAMEIIGGTCRSLLKQGAALAPLASTQRWIDSDFYQDVFRPVGAGEILRLFLRRGSAPLGVLTFGRVAGARAIDARERSALLGLKPLYERIAARFAAPPAVPADPLAEVPAGPEAPTDEAMWIATRSGQVTLASPGAERLAVMAYGTAGPLRAFDRQVAPWLRETFRLLHQQLQRGIDALFERWTAFGRFQFRATWLNSPPSRRRGALLSVQLSRHVPLATRLFQSRRFRELPRREKQTMLALAEGASTQETSKQLRVAPSTVLTWIRSLYLRFDVNRRSELITLLLAEAAAEQRARAALRASS